MIVRGPAALALPTFRGLVVELKLPFSFELTFTLSLIGLISVFVF